MDRNRKGQLGVTGILLFFIAVVIVAAFIPLIATNQQSMAQTYVFNGTAVPAAANGDTFVTGAVLVGTPSSVINESGGTIDCSKNVTFSTGVSPTTGVATVKMTSNALISGVYCTRKLNVSYTYGADGYVADAGARGISQLIVLFAVIALLGVAIFFFIKQGGLDFLS